MDRKKKAALGMIPLLAAAFSLAPLAGQAEEPVNLEKTSWTSLAGMYDNPYFTPAACASLSPEVLSEW